MLVHSFTVNIHFGREVHGTVFKVWIHRVIKRAVSEIPTCSIHIRFLPASYVFHSNIALHLSLNLLLFSCFEFFEHFVDDDHSPVSPLLIHRPVFTHWERYASEVHNASVNISSNEVALYCPPDLWPVSPAICFLFSDTHTHWLFLAKLSFCLFIFSLTS